MSATPEQKKDLLPRPPIVAVVGHVDHGKTTLLDYIKKTRVAEREAGGITQSVGAYEIEKNGQRITFIDTPGHAAFTKMRERGTRVADLAVLVVAADDGVKPQTKEAIEILRNEKTPFVVAINKIDKNNADPERTKQSLLKEQVLLEQYGGDVSWVEISAKEGTGVDELLDHILLMWEIDKPAYDPAARAEGFVLESERDSRKGIVVSVIIKNGTLHEGDPVRAQNAFGKVRMLENFLGERVKELIPASPAVILGFETLPDVGTEFVSGEILPEDDVLPKPAVERKERNISVEDAGEGNMVKLILKADVSGTLEALEQIILNTPVEGKIIRILSREVGDITDTDVKNAEMFGSYIVGFNVKPSKNIEAYAKAKNIRLILSDVIYRIVEELQEMAKHLGEVVVLGKMEILATFSQKNKRQVIGGKVSEGYFTLHEKFIVMRNGERAGTGKALNLQKGKNDVKKVEAGEECGMFVESSVPIEKGDELLVEQAGK